MNILVTGGAGFIGGYLVERLVADGHAVRCLVRNVETAKADPKLKGAELVKGDLTDAASIAGVADDIDAVAHLAAMGHVSAVTEEAYRRFMAINVGGTEHLVAECVRAGGVKRFIHVSSTAAMGLIKKDGRVDETTEPAPATPYQKSKRQSELAAMKAWEDHGLPVSILRPCMVYGPGGTGEFHKMCRLMKKGVFPKVGCGKNLTPAVFVSDVADGIAGALSGARAGQSYFIADERSHVLDELRGEVVKALGVNPPYPYVPAWLALAGAKGVEVLSRLLGKQPIVTYRNMLSTVTDREFSIDAARKDFGYAPKVSMHEAVSRTVAWYIESGLI